MKIFDTHSHYADNKYDEDRLLLFNKMFNEGVSDITLIGASKKESEAVVTLSSFYKNEINIPKLYYTIGVHPDEIINEIPSSSKGVRHLEKLKLLANGSVGIGEIGLDYYGEGKDDKLKLHQKEWFIAYLELAKELKLPIVVHSREACKDTLDIIKEYGKDLSGVIHCFAYEKEVAKEYVDMGYFIGVGGVVTFKNGRKTKEVVSYIPIDKIVTETDSPWLSPTPHRGERNESTHIKYVIKEIANIKNIEIEKVANIVYENAYRLYCLKV